MSNSDLQKVAKAIIKLSELDSDSIEVNIAKQFLNDAKMMINS